MDVDEDGCIDSTEDDDDDNDGILDTDDKCRYTPSGLEVDSEGCSGVQLDDDGDGVHNLNDLCPATLPGDVVSSTGCTVKTTDVGKSIEDSEETSYLIWFLFGVAGVLVAIAAYVTFRPEPSKTKSVPKVDQNPPSIVNDGGGQGDSSTTSADVNDPDSISMLESPRSLQMNSDAAERIAPSLSLPQIMDFSSSDHLKICGSMRLPQKPIISPLFSSLTNSKSVSALANAFTLPPELM